jgi:hypothetical protein
VIIEVERKEQTAKNSDFKELFLARLLLGKIELKDFPQVIDVEKHLPADLPEGSFIFEGFKLFDQDFLEFFHNELSLLRCKIFNKLA